MTRPYLDVPPLSLTFRSRGYINTSLPKENEGMVAPLHALTINVITEDKEKVENSYPTVYPYHLDSELNNRSIVEIPIAYKLSK